MLPYFFNYFLRKKESDLVTPPASFQARDPQGIPILNTRKFSMFCKLYKCSLTLA